MTAQGRIDSRRGAAGRQRLRYIGWGLAAAAAGAAGTALAFGSYRQLLRQWGLWGAVLAAVFALACTVAAGWWAGPFARWLRRAAAADSAGPTERLWSRDSRKGYDRVNRGDGGVRLPPQ